MATTASPRRPQSHWNDGEQQPYQRTPHSPAYANTNAASPRTPHLPHAPHPPRATVHHNDVGGHGGAQNMDDMSGSLTRERIEGARRAAATLEFEEDADVDPDLRERIEKGLVDPSDIAQPTSDDLELGPRQIVRRKVKKLVEVPVVRKVKVPVVEQQVVPDVVKTKVKVKKQIQVQEWKVVEEAYTEVEEQPATRMKEVWIKKLVPETYMKRVEVRKVRMTKVPITVTKEVEEEAEVEVATTKVVDVHSYRIDEVKDTKLMELEGWQELELVPRVKDSSIKIDRSRELDRRKRRIERKQGHEVLKDHDQRLDQIDTDSDPSDNEANVVKSEGRVPLDGTEHRTRPRNNRAASSRGSARGGGVPRR